MIKFVQYYSGANTDKIIFFFNWDNKFFSFKDDFEMIKNFYYGMRTYLWLKFVLAGFKSFKGDRHDPLVKGGYDI
jgi:hypothetical protein